MSDKLPVIGHWTCPEGGRAEVTQSRRNGAHFNTRCDCCGYSQATGAKRQQSIWDRAEFIPGVTVKRPSNVVDTQPEPVNEPTPEPAPALESEPNEATEKPTEPQPQNNQDFDPDAEPEQPESTDTETENSGGVGKVLVPALAFGLAAVGAALWNI